MNDERRFMDFLELAPRSKKPRSKGLTCVGDEGDPLPWVRDMLETWGDYVDSVKFVPALLMMPARIVEQRIKMYRDFNIDVALDDPIFGIAYYQGKGEELLRKARDMGFTYGTYAIAASGPIPAEKGFYTRVWVRGRDGAWKLALDVLQPQ